MTITVIVILAITVEALIEYGKLIFGKTINWKQIAAILVAVGLAIVANTDLYAILGVAFRVPYVGVVLTGIIFSRGANYVADFMKLAQNKATAMASLSVPVTHEQEDDNGAT